MTRTAVVHLVRDANGPEPFQAFLDSYRRHDAGLDHDLVLLCKGFGDDAALAPYLERAQAEAPRTLLVSDDGFDLTAYGHAVQRLEHERVCLVNSFSEILAPGWLGLLDAALADGAGAAGTTGSWASPRSYGLWLMGVRTPYSAVFPSRREVRHAMHELAGSTPASAPADWLYNVVMTVARCRGMAPFPSMHLRTNGFLVDREVLRAMRLDRAATKWDTYRLESGRRSISSQLPAPPVMVDRHGTAHGPDAWPRADVFWQAEQQDLLVADNQTRSYAQATAAQRAILSGHAWGVHSRPAGGAP